METFGLTDLGYSIFLDRYSHKDPHAAQNVKVGHTVLVVKDQKRLIATVTNLTQTEATVKYTISEEIETVPRSNLDLPLELDPKQMHQRVATAIASVEQNPQHWESEFKWLLDGWKFVPAGRILSSAGTPYQLTAFNCFVLNSPKDSRGGIVDNLKNMIELMSRGGGVGQNLSSLRPKHAYVRGVNGRSSGPVSWAELYSTATGLIEQAGSRRGAAMLMLADWHPDIFDFVASKREAGHITNANISVCFSDQFMEQVRLGGDWVLRFPDTTYPDYNETWDGDIFGWEAAGKPVIEYRTIKAQELWDAVIESAHASAEPGVFFIERANKMSNSNYYEGGKIIATNPCAEEPLSAWATCNLGAINLAQFATGVGTVHWTLLAKTVELAVRFLDNVIDWSPYHFEENRQQALNERRVGLGTMGLAELMIQCGVRYGSKEGQQFADKLYQFIAKQAYWASINLAKEKGSFPKFNANGFLYSGFMQCMEESFHNEIRQHGIRNVTLLTSAPTGTTATMLNTSTGIEPFYALTWWRQSRLGWAEEKLPLLSRFGDDLPDYVVTAMQLSPNEHVMMQAAAQRWIDAAISKTVNVPNHWTVDQVKEVYQLMYDSGCKGGTIYRDGSRGEQVLHLEKPKETLTCTECGEVVEESTCDVPCTHCGFMGCAVS